MLDLDSLRQRGVKIDHVMAALERKAAKRAAGRKLQSRFPNLRDFVRECWPLIEPAPFIPGWHIDALCDHLEAVSRGQIKDIIINFPPRMSKTLICSVLWLAWHWGEVDSKTRFLTATHSIPLSERDSRLSLDLIESDWYRNHYGDRVVLNPTYGVNRYKFRSGGGRIITSVGKGATGEGGEIILVDDPIQIVDSDSKTMRDRCNAWWSGTMSTRSNNPGTRRVIVMQRCNEDDLSGYLLARNAGWDHFSLPMRYEPQRSKVTGIGFRDPRKEPGELLCPARFGEQHVANLEKELGPYRTAGQLQQRPAPMEGGIIKKDWLRFWRYDDLPRFEEVSQSWDCTFKSTASGSYVVGQVWARRGANNFLLHQVRRRMEFVELVQAVRQTVLEYPATGSIYIEEKANGAALISALRQEIAGIIPVNHDRFGDKAARLQAVSKYFHAGNVWIPSPDSAEWVDDYIGELTSFPNAANDDQVDATSQILREWRIHEFDIGVLT